MKKITLLFFCLLMHIAVKAQMSDSYVAQQITELGKTEFEVIAIQLEKYDFVSYHVMQKNDTTVYSSQFLLSNDSLCQYVHKLFYFHENCCVEVIYNYVCATESENYYKFLGNEIVGFKRKDGN